MGVGDAVVSVVSASFTVGGSHISPHRGDSCSDVEACGGMDVATGACSSCGGLWRSGR
jgi:hypothetical protein